MVQYPTLHKIQNISIRRTRQTKVVLKAEDASKIYTIINLLSGPFIFLTIFRTSSTSLKLPCYIQPSLVSIRAFQTFLQIIIPLSPLMSKNSIGIACVLEWRV